jgi:hypothetical protein
MGVGLFISLGNNRGSESMNTPERSTDHLLPMIKLRDNDNQHYARPYDQDQPLAKMRSQAAA